MYVRSSVNIPVHRVNMARNVSDVGLLGLQSRVGSKAANDRNSWPEINSLFRNDSLFRSLQSAAKDGRGKEVSELLAMEGAENEIAEENERGETALHLAAKGGHHEIVKQLIQKCELSLKEKFVNHRSHYSKSEPGDEGNGESGSNDLSCCFIIDIPQLFLEATPKADKNTHRTPLHYASEGGHLETVKYLLSTPEVQVGLADRDGNTALHLAINKRNNNGDDGSDVLKELLAAPKVDVNYEGSLGDTPLHRAVRMENIGAVELLCRTSRIVATKTNHDGRTPLRLASELMKLKSCNKDTLEMVKIELHKKSDVKILEEQFKSERETLYMAVNALLVGGTLLASVTYGGILEMPTLPPLSDFEQLTTPIKISGAPPAPAQEDDYKQRQWLYVRVIDLFRGSNNMCFFLAIVTLILAIQVPISRRRAEVHVYVEEELEHLRTRSSLVSFCLTLSTFCAGVAFVTGGLAKVPVSESGWSLVLSHWVRREWKLLFQSTMLTTDLSMGFVLFIILTYTITMDYFFMLRYQISTKVSLPSLATFLFSVLLFALLLAVIVLLIVGSGLFQNYSSNDQK